MHKKSDEMKDIEERMKRVINYQKDGFQECAQKTTRKPKDVDHHRHNNQ